MFKSSFFPGALARNAFWAVYYFWIVAELGVRYLTGRRKEAAAQKGDGGSYWIIVGGIFVGLWLAFAFRGAGIGLLPAWTEWPGLLVMLLGIALRTWAIFLLGRFFSVRVELQAGHRVVSAGPYRYIRHPAYTGSMVTLAGVGLALGSWLAVLLIAALFWLVYSFRVRVEEAFLLSSLGDEYRAYMRRTGRFFPSLAALKAPQGAGR